MVSIFWSWPCLCLQSKHKKALEEKNINRRVSWPFSSSFSSPFYFSPSTLLFLCLLLLFPLSCHLHHLSRYSPLPPVFLFDCALSIFFPCIFVPSGFSSPPLSKDLGPHQSSDEASSPVPWGHNGFVAVSGLRAKRYVPGSQPQVHEGPLNHSKKKMTVPFGSKTVQMEASPAIGKTSRAEKEKEIRENWCLLGHWCVNDVFKIYQGQVCLWKTIPICN